MNRNSIYPIAAMLSFISAVLPACKPSGPTVTIMSPSNGAQFPVNQPVMVQFHAEDDQAVVWVQLTADGEIVAVRESTSATGQTPLDGTLRWVPRTTGSVQLILIAYNAFGQKSQPAAISVQVTQAAASTQATATPTAQPTLPPTEPVPTEEDQTSPVTTPTPAVSPTITSIPSSPVPPTTVPTATVVPAPEIVTFATDREVLTQGECATLRWATANAERVTLNGRLVDGPAGQETVCHQDLETGTTSFRLSAENSRDIIFEELSITVPTPSATVVPAPFVADQSGSVDADGQILSVISAGDDGSDVDREGFVTFDLQDLPPNATVISASLDLGPCSVSGEPADLGDLRIAHLQYGDLESTDYVAGGDYITAVVPCQLIVPIDVASFIEAARNESLFQIRLYFDGSDNDGNADVVTFTLPLLTVLAAVP